MKIILFENTIMSSMCDIDQKLFNKSATNSSILDCTFKFHLADMIENKCAKI